jgi:hypothetical protein
MNFAMQGVRASSVENLVTLRINANADLRSRELANVVESFLTLTSIPDT